MKRVGAVRAQIHSRSSASKVRASCTKSRWYLHTANKPVHSALYCSLSSVNYCNSKARSLQSMNSKLYLEVKNLNCLNHQNNYVVRLSSAPRWIRNDVRSKMADVNCWINVDFVFDEVLLSFCSLLNCHIIDAVSYANVTNTLTRYWELVEVCVCKLKQ